MTFVINTQVTFFLSKILPKVDKIRTLMKIFLSLQHKIELI